MEIMKWLICLGLCAAAALEANATRLLTFDELDPQGGAGPMPADYAELKWDNFGLMKPLATPLVGGGYVNGIVSPDNVAFPALANGNGSTTGGFRTVGGALFTLESAYLTAAFNDGLQVQVFGYVGGVEKYRNIYTVNPTEPTLIQFNYVAISRVALVSFGGTPNPSFGGGGTGVAVDNMVLSVPEPSSVALLLLGGVCGLLGRYRTRLWNQ